MYDSALSSYHHRQLYNNHAFCKEYIMGKLFFKKHGACFSKAGMELECFRENMRGLAVAVERMLFQSNPSAGHGKSGGRHY